MKQTLLILLLIISLCFTVFAQEEDFRLAIMPFENIGDSKEYEWISKGVSETLTKSLSQIPTLRLVDRSNIDQILAEWEFALSDLANQETAPRIGSLLSANKLLTGSYQISGNEILFNCNITDVETGILEQDKSVSARGSINSIFDLYEILIDELLIKFNIEIDEEEKVLLAEIIQSTDSLEAYIFYLQGMEALRTFTLEGYEEAKDYFFEATFEDPSYALAYTGLAEATTYLAYEKYIIASHINIYGENDSIKYKREQEYLDLYVEALGYARTASALAPRLPDVQRALTLTQYYLGDYTEARISVQTLLALNKNDAFGYYLMALLQEQGEMGERYINKALELDPNLGPAYLYLGFSYELRDDYENAISSYITGLEKTPNNPDLRFYLGSLYFYLGQYDNAVPHMELALELRPDHAYATLILAIVLFKTGTEVPAYQLYDKAINLNWTFYSGLNVLLENYKWERNMIRALGDLRAAYDEW